MRTARAGQRPPRSIVGLLLERDGPAALGTLLADARRCGPDRQPGAPGAPTGSDESAWPAAEDRFASDLLLHEQIVDPWLRDLTRSAATASIPILLGGHTLVGPGLRLLLAAPGR